MGKFESGDRIVNKFGEFATVFDSKEVVTLQWDSGINGLHPASAFELVARKFKPGDWVRTVTDDDLNGVVGIVFEDDGSHEDNEPYGVGLFNAAEDEEYFSASELIPWMPKIGERVIEANVDDDEVGVVTAVSGTTARVLWESFPLAQEWQVSDLEPADDEDDGFAVGEVVDYESPFFIGTIPATVKGSDGNVLHVRFQNHELPEGYYSKDFFSKKAA